MVPEVDLDSWSFKPVPITTSAELENLEKNAQYAVMVAARSKAVSCRVTNTSWVSCHYLLKRVRGDWGG